MGPKRTIQHNEGSCGTIWDHTGQNRPVRDNTVQYRIVQDHKDCYVWYNGKKWTDWVSERVRKWVKTCLLERLSPLKMYDFDYCNQSSWEGFVILNCAKFCCEVSWLWFQNLINLVSLQIIINHLTMWGWAGTSSVQTGFGLKLDIRFDALSWLI